MKRDDYLDRQQVDWQHRAIRAGAAVTIVTCLFILLWVRP
jgi:CHASE3 domain sensor protein